MRLVIFTATQMGKIQTRDILKVSSLVCDKVSTSAQINLVPKRMVFLQYHSVPNNCLANVRQLQKLLLMPGGTMAPLSVVHSAKCLEIFLPD
jgi:hypothetical protein